MIYNISIEALCEHLNALLKNKHEKREGKSLKIKSVIKNFMVNLLRIFIRCLHRYVYKLCIIFISSITCCGNLFSLSSLQPLHGFLLV